MSEDVVNILIARMEDMSEALAVVRDELKSLKESYYALREAQAVKNQEVLQLNYRLNGLVKLNYFLGGGLMSAVVAMVVKFIF